jgi:hypothetical protein
MNDRVNGHVLDYPSSQVREKILTEGRIYSHRQGLGVGRSTLLVIYSIRSKQI